MIVGKMLKEKYGFDSAAVVEMFCEQYGYSRKFVEDLLNDKWTDLLLCHEMDILDFTKIDESLFRSWTDEYSFSNTCAPMGKAYDNPMAKLPEINLGSFEPKLFVRHTAFGSQVRAGFFPNPDEVEFKPEAGDLTPRALDMLKAIGMAPITVDLDGNDGGLSKKLADIKAEWGSEPVVHNSNMPVPRAKHTHELDEEDVNLIYPQRTVNLLEGIDLQPIPLLETIPKLSDLVSPDWENIAERPEVIPDPGPDNIIVPLELFESMADACSDGGFSVPATRAYDLLEKHEEKYGE